MKKGKGRSDDMDHFADRLAGAVERKRSCVVVGLDPRLNALPPELRERADRSPEDAADAVLEFNRRVIAAVALHAVAVKPQIAFYEALGWPGFRTYGRTIRIAHDSGLLVIGDVKRGDIGSTAEAYAQAHFDLLDADALTINPYLGTDALKPFLDRIPKAKGVFVLVKTSNPSSTELQDLDAGGSPLYEKVAELVRSWGADYVGQCGYSAVGAVVGATFPAAVERLRRLMPRAVFLVPGYGAQGARAEDCRVCFDKHGHGAVVNSSRGIIFAYARSEHPDAAEHWEKAVEQAAADMKTDLERVRKPGS